MFQDLDGIRFDNAFRRAKPGPGSVILCFSGDAVWARTDGDRLDFPRLTEASQTLPSELRYGFSLDDTPYFLGDAEEAPAPLPWAQGEGWGYAASRDYRAMGPPEAVFAAAVGESLHRWYQSRRFCGRCGTPMEDSQTERARVCPACGLTEYPKLCPAVIVAVTDGDRLLLTKYQGRSFRRYALVAGFAEIGEPIEDTVRREVYEETGLRVKNLRYYKSQPWVFTDSLLMGFYCDLEGSDKITLQRSELSEGGWYHRREIPGDYSPISLTGEMITRFRDGEA